MSTKVVAIRKVEPPEFGDVGCLHCLANKGPASKIHVSFRETRWRQQLRYLDRDIIPCPVNLS